MTGGAGLRICFCDLAGRPYADLGAHDTGCLEHDRAAAAAWRERLAATPWTPLRDLLKRHPPPRYELPGACYRSEYGFTVHVRPSCTCHRKR